MSGNYKLVDDYPIVITVMDGRIDFQDMLSNYAVVDNYLTSRELSKVYWIIDWATIDFSRETAIQIAEATKNALPGSGGDPGVVPLIIMPRENYAHIENELRNRHFTLQYPLFDTIYEAYTFALFLINSGDAGKAF